MANICLRLLKFAVKTSYDNYPEIMKWFILEENRHSQTLKKYMEIYNIKPAEKLWIDNIFRNSRNTVLNIYRNLSILKKMVQ